MCVKSMRMRIEVIEGLKTHTTPKGCRSFAGAVNFLSLFCPEVQELLKPIYDITRKGKVFLWGSEQQEAFDEIKRQLQKPPVLYMFENKVRFHLYLTSVSSLLVVHYTKFRMDSKG